MKNRFLVALIALAMVLSLAGAVVAAPNVVSGFTITPSTVYSGNTVSFAVAYKISVTNNDNAICLYYDNSAWDSIFSGATATSSRGATYAFQAAGTSGVECDAPATYGRTRVAEWSALALGVAYRLFGDTLTLQGTVPSVGGPAAGSYAFDMIQEEGLACATTGLPCAVADGSSASVTIANTPANVFVSNDATCGANSPCKTGPTALQDAYDIVAAGGTINIVGTYSLGASNTVNLTSKAVTLIGVSTPVLENGAGTCSGSMLNVTANITIRNLTLDGSCGSGSRTNGVLVAGGATNVINVAIRNFTSGNGVQTTSGTAIVEGSTFTNNNIALDGSTGTLYAFANNVPTNIALNAATNIKATDNVKCNYWAGYSLSGADEAAQYEKRLGAPVSTYIENNGALALGRANLAAAGSGSGYQVIVNMGRNTPPFNNGTVLGLGAQTSDFFAFCLSRDGSNLGVVTITSDGVAAGPTGHRLYRIDTTSECSPSTNMLCWDHTGATSAGGAISAALTPTVSSEGQYVIGNQIDPTAVTLRDLEATTVATPWTLILAAIAGVAALLALGLIVRRRTVKA